MRRTLDAPPVHRIAALELHAALAAATQAGAAGAPATAERDFADCVAALATSLQGHPAQQQAFATVWR